MIRTLLATTALAGLLATSALAQNTTAQSPAAAPQAPATATDGSAAPAVTANAGDYVQRLEADQYLASTLTGQDLYETSAPDARKVGEIQNFVIGQDGKIAAVVIATSGLENDKTVAAPADKIEWTNGGNGEQRAVLKTNVAELQGAPEFLHDSAQKAADNGAVVPGSGAQVASPAAPAAPTATANTDMAANNAAASANTGAMSATPAAPNSAAMGSANGYLAALGSDQKLSEDVIGSNVYSGPGSDAQTIGSVNDLVFTKAGDIPAAIVGVGGFLGIGEKNVGVPYGKLNVQSENGDATEPRLIMAATKEQLTAAPAFEEEENTQRTAAVDAGQQTAVTAATGAATAGAAAPTTAAQNADSAATMNADPSTTASTGNANDRSSMQPVSGPELTADNLKGVAVYGPNDQSIGKVGDIALTGDGRVDAIVVDVGGFLGIGSKPVAVAMDNLQFMRDTNGNVNVYSQFTEDQLKNAPEFNRESYAENRGTMRLENGNAPAQANDAAGSGTSQPAQ